MKKIIMLGFIFLLTGCKASCDLEFTTKMTKDYSKDAKKCEVVTYKNKKQDITFVTTPSEDKKTFTVKIDYAGYEFMHSYMDINYTNLKLNQYNGINFLELYDTAKVNNVYLVLFDDAGNVRYEIPSTKSPIVDGEIFTAYEYYTFVDGDYICDNYSNKNVTAYTETTYNMMDMSVISSKKYLIKDVCK